MMPKPSKEKSAPANPSSPMARLQKAAEVKKRIMSGPSMQEMQDMKSRKPMC